LEIGWGLGINSIPKSFSLYGVILVTLREKIRKFTDCRNISSFLFLQLGVNSIAAISNTSLI